MVELVILRHQYILDGLAWTKRLSSWTATYSPTIPTSSPILSGKTDPFGTLTTFSSTENWNESSCSLAEHWARSVKTTTLLTKARRKCSKSWSTENDFFVQSVFLTKNISLNSWEWLLQFFLSRVVDHILIYCRDIYLDTDFWQGVFKDAKILQTSCKFSNFCWHPEFLSKHLYLIQQHLITTTQYCITFNNSVTKWYVLSK